MLKIGQIRNIISKISSDEYEVLHYKQLSDIVNTKLNTWLEEWQIYVKYDGKIYEIIFLVEDYDMFIQHYRYDDEYIFIKDIKNIEHYV